MNGHWLETRLAAIGKSKKDLAHAVFQGRPAAVSEILAKRRRISAEEIPDLAHFLKLPTVEVFRLVIEDKNAVIFHGNTIAIPILGSVQAGEWREPMLESSEYIGFILPNKIPKTTFGLQVIGDSMNQFYQEGRIVLCVPMHDYNGCWENGDHVVVQRQGENGLVEVTLKEIQRDQEGRFWLWPRSTHPDFQTPWLLPGLDPEASQAGAGDIYILAVVIGDYQIRKTI